MDFGDTSLSPALYNWLLLAGRKISTAKNIKGQLNYIFSQNLSLKTPTDIPGYIDKCKIEGASSAKINNIVNCCRTYAKFCKEKGIEYDTILETLPFVKDKFRPRATMSDTEIESFLSLPRLTNTGKTTHRYWKVFFSIMAYTGMRTGEVAKLKVEDIDFSQDIFYLKDTKTNENRLVPIPSNIRTLVYDWVNTVGKGYLFYSIRPEGHTSNVEWHYQFKVRIQKLEINRPNLTPYSLRHSYITEMLQTEGVNLFDVKNLVGHRNTRTTENYYHLTTKRLKRVVARHPSVRKSSSAGDIFKLIEEFVENLGLQNEYAVEKSVTDSELYVRIKRKASLD